MIYRSITGKCSEFRQVKFMLTYSVYVVVILRGRNCIYYLNLLYMITINSGLHRVVELLQKDSKVGNTQRNNRVPGSTDSIKVRYGCLPCCPFKVPYDLYNKENSPLVFERIFCSRLKNEIDRSC